MFTNFGTFGGRFRPSRTVVVDQCRMDQFPRSDGGGKRLRRVDL